MIGPKHLMMKIFSIVLLLVLALAIQAKIDEQKVHKRRGHFHKLSPQEKASHLQKVVDLYQKKHPNVDSEQVKQFLGTQYYSNVHSKRVVKLYHRTFYGNRSFHKGCLFLCLVKKLGKEKVREIIQKCKRDLKCWKKETGEAGKTCKKGCKAFCLFGCLKRKLGAEKFKKIAEKCKKDKKCWKKESGEAFKPCKRFCRGRRFSHHFGHHHGCPFKKLNIEGPKNPRCVMKCLVKKLGADKVKEIYQKCKRDFKCWAKETGEVGKKCVEECKKPEEVIQKTETVVKVEKKVKSVTSEPDIQCIIRCIRPKLEFQEYLRISMKCRYEHECWKEEAAEHYEGCAKQCGGSSPFNVVFHK